jgi:hypothetical protein
MDFGIQMSFTKFEDLMGLVEIWYARIFVEPQETNYMILKVWLFKSPKEVQAVKELATWKILYVFLVKNHLGAPPFP